jgi:hypothetical protein
VSAVQVAMFGSANTTNCERNVADEAAAKEREACAKMSFCELQLDVSSQHEPVVTNLMDVFQSCLITFHADKLFRLTQSFIVIFQHYTFRSKTITSGVFSTDS